MDVAANSYGLSDKDILYGDDKALNQFVSVKKLAPYRQDNGMINMKKSKLKKQLAKKTAERNYVSEVMSCSYREIYSRLSIVF